MKINLSRQYASTFHQKRESVRANFPQSRFPTKSGADTVPAITANIIWTTSTETKAHESIFVLRKRLPANGTGKYLKYNFYAYIYRAVPRGQSVRLGLRFCIFADRYFFRFDNIIGYLIRAKRDKMIKIHRAFTGDIEQKID